MEKSSGKVFLIFFAVLCLFWTFVTDHKKNVLISKILFISFFIWETGKSGDIHMCRNKS